MRCLEWTVVVVTAFLFVACGGKNSENCPDGYHWDDETKQCAQDTSLPDEAGDADIVTDDASLPDEEADMEDGILPDDDGYTGPCLFAQEGGVVTFDVTLHAVTIGALAVGGAANDGLVAGELWAEDETTKSEFKVADLSPSLSGKSFGFAPGTYAFYYRGAKSQPDDPDHSRVLIAQHEAVGGARTLALDLPLYEVSGAVTKNGAAFPALAGAAAADTKVTLQSGSYAFEIPYAEFASFTRTLPLGTYTATFSGNLSEGAPVFYGKVLFGNTALAVDGATSAPVDIVTAAVSGSVAVDGAAVDEGVLAIVKDPPLEPIATALVADLGAGKNYDVEVIANEGVAYTVIYLADAADYPYSMLRIAQWGDLAPAVTGGVTLDLGRVHGTLSLGAAGTPFPALTSCQPSEAQCTRGKLKATSMASGTVILKDLGASGDDHAYSALLVRRQKVCEDIDCTTFKYTAQPFSLIFESYFNDVAGMINYLPFATKVSVNGNDSFQFVSGSDFTTDMQLDIVVAPTAVSGTVTFDGAAVSGATGDMLFVRDTTTQAETPVVNLSSLSGGVFSFRAPAGSYHVVYKGSHLFGYDQRGVISTDLVVGTDDITGRQLDIGTAKIQLDIAVGGQSPEDFLTAHPALDRYDISAMNDKNALGTSAITPVAADPHPYIRLLKSSAWDLYLNLYVKEGSETSVSRFPIAQLLNVTGDTLAGKDLTVVAFEGALTANGAPVTGATAARAELEVTGDTRAKVYFPPSGNARFLLAPATYGNPSPQMTLGDGFDLAQRIAAPCILVSE